LICKFKRVDRWITSQAYTGTLSPIIDMTQINPEQKEFMSTTVDSMVRYLILSNTEDQVPDKHRKMDTFIL
jgi:hypothetical protein